MQGMSTDMSAVVHELIAQQTEIFALFDDERVPRPRPPIDEAALQRLAQWWAARGGQPPASYIAFLRVCDGIEDFSFSYDLYGAADLLSQAYEEVAAELDPAGLGLPEGELNGGQKGLVLLGRNDDAETRLIADLRHATLQAGETVIYDGEPGNWSLHESFGDFLRMRIQANKLTMAEIKRVQSLGDEA
jgi:hypothetical protein